MLNWIFLIAGLVIIGAFWHFISSEARKRETHIVSLVFLCLGIVVYFIQTTMLG